MARTEIRGGQILDSSVSLTADVSGTLPVANGGTGSASQTLNNVLLGNGTGALQNVAPGSSGNVLQSNGTTWQSTVLTTQLAAVRRDGWAFPDGTINALTDIAATRFYSIKPIWYEVNSSGALVLRNTSGYGANFYYTSANAKTVREASTEQYVSVSLSDATDMDTLCSSSGNRATAIAALKQFCVDNDFTGVELDWEDYGAWTGGQYTNYKIFVTELGNSLHADGFKLMVDAPPIWNNSLVVTANEWTNRNSQGYYQFTYEDFNTLPVDSLCILAYDYQYDMGAGEPTQPLAWLEDIIQWAKSKITDNSRISVGIPTAGYSGATGGYSITGRTYSYLSAQTGFGGASRDSASGELIWANAGVSYSALDETSVNLKVKRAESLGINRVSLWHIGNNKYDNTRQYPVFNVSTDSVNRSGDTMVGDLNVPDEAYGIGWDGSLEVPTKNALYDKIQTLGGGSGITRTVTTTSGSFTAGATAAVDYIYLLAGAHVPTLPTAVGNTNRYTFKNNHSANITFLTTSSQTIDGGTLVLAPEEAVDLISNNANWYII